jgi:hypothetical protein
VKPATLLPASNLRRRKLRINWQLADAFNEQGWGKRWT